MHQSLPPGSRSRWRRSRRLPIPWAAASALATGAPSPWCAQLVDEVVLLTEAQIAGAMRALFLQEGWVAEGAGAVGIAPLLEPGLATLGRRVAVVISGRNVDMGLFRRIVDGEVPS